MIGVCEGSSSSYLLALKRRKKVLDKNGYPDKKSLKEIKEWDILKYGIQGLLDLVEENTNWPEWSFIVTGKRVLHIEYHTGGWSGNEDVIDALQHNLLFWPLCWVKSTRGGHYYFEIKPKLLEGSNRKNKLRGVNNA